MKKATKQNKIKPAHTMIDGLPVIVYVVAQNGNQLTVQPIFGGPTYDVAKDAVYSSILELADAIS